MGARGGSGSIGVSSGIEVRREPFLPEAPVDNAAGARIAPCCQAEPEGGSRGLIYIEIGTEIIEGLRG